MWHEIYFYSESLIQCLCFRKKKSHFEITFIGSKSLLKELSLGCGHFTSKCSDVITVSSLVMMWRADMNSVSAKNYALSNCNTIYTVNVSVTPAKPIHMKQSLPRS